MTTLVKICGLSTPATLDAALNAGADMVGFVRFPRSPRHLELERAAELSRQAAGRVERVLLVVDPTDEELDEAIAAIRPDLVQLHGRETPERVAAIRAHTGRPVMKAIGIANAADLAHIDAYRGAADRLLLDAKPPAGSTLPGGNGLTFDWRILADSDIHPGDLLSGGLTPGNVAEAILVSGAAGVDVSSGVERRRGEKDSSMIAAFVRAARAAFADASRRVRMTP